MFLFSKTFKPALGPAQGPIKWVGDYFPGARRPGREVYQIHLVPRSGMRAVMPLLSLYAFITCATKTVLWKNSCR